MSTIDDLLKWDDGEKEMDFEAGGFKDLPLKKWLVFQAKGADEGGTSAVEPPSQYRTYCQFRLGLRVVGGEADVPAGNYQTAYHRFNLDTVEQPGVPSPKLKSMINTFFGEGLPHNSPERNAASKAVLNATIAKFGMDPNLTDSDGLPIYASPAVFLGAVFAAALGDLKPMVLAQPYLKKGRAWENKETKESGVSKDRVEVGGWTDFTPASQDEKGVVVWGQPADEGAVAI